MHTFCNKASTHAFTSLPFLWCVKCCIIEIICSNHIHFACCWCKHRICSTIEHYKIQPFIEIVYTLLHIKIYSRVPLWRGPVWHDIAYIASMSKAEYTSRVLTHKKTRQGYIYGKKSRKHSVKNYFIQTSHRSCNVTNALPQQSVRYALLTSTASYLHWFRTMIYLFLIMNHIFFVRQTKYTVRQLQVRKYNANWSIFDF